MKPDSSRLKSLFRLIMGWCGLLLYLALLSPLGVAVTAALGSLDPDHHAVLQVDASGIRLVLHHQEGCAGHQHHAVARVLTLFARPATATDPDHVVKFAQTDGCWREIQALVSNEDVRTSQVTAGVQQGLDFVPRPELSRWLAHPPPDPVQRSCNVRFTVLLI